MSIQMRQHHVPHDSRRVARATLAAGAALLSQAAFAATMPREDSIGLGEIVVTATRIETPSLSVPYVTHVLTGSQVQLLNQSRTLPEALRDIPGVSVQKTAHGQGSPYIRGFTGFRNVMLVDGIRLNNSVFRDGPNQYWSTVDLFSFDRLEVLKGPSSVLYGSDAVGGIVNALSDHHDNGQRGLAISLLDRYATAENANTVRSGASFASEDWRAHGGVTVKDYGDLEGGHDVGRQLKTGYEELDADFRLDVDLGADTVLSFAHQYVDVNDAWRSHRTIYGFSWHGTTVGTDKKLSLDQRRNLSYVQLRTGRLGSVADAALASLSYHLQQEDQDRVRSNNRRELSGFDTGTIGLALEFEKQSALGHWIYGADYYHDDVNSYGVDYNADGSLLRVRIQGSVADDARYDLAGVYVQDSLALSPRWDVTLGTRYTYAAAGANKVQDPVTGQQISLTDHWEAVVGSARFGFLPSERSPWRLFGGISQAFRAPNLSDLTSFDIALSNELNTPAIDLSPERFVTYELGTKIDGRRGSAQVAIFYTDIQDLIVRQPTGRMIESNIEVTKANASGGSVQGIEAQFAYAFSGAWTAFANAFWIDGEAETYATSAPVATMQPLSKLMPPTASAGLRWHSAAGGLKIEAIASVADRQDKLSTADRTDTQRIPPGGTPGYAVVSLRSRWQVTPALGLSLAVENIGDVDYRIHGSGVNQPGRNVVVTASWTP
jgi:hemoglobin/transferrin/lactoferrin receptor protein